MKKRIDLMNLTGQESGIVVREDDSIICNWSHDEGLPYLDPTGTGLIFLEAEAELIGQNDVDNIAGYVTSEIIYDRNGDAETLNGHPGTVYELSVGDEDARVIIIAPNDWA